MLKFAHILGKDLCHNFWTPAPLSQTPSPGLRVETGVRRRMTHEGPGHIRAPGTIAVGRTLLSLLGSTLACAEAGILLAFCLLCLLGSRIMATALC